jgi:hypothetical protein
VSGITSVGLSAVAFVVGNSRSIALIALMVIGMLLVARGTYDLAA